MGIQQTIFITGKLAIVWGLGEEKKDNCLTHRELQKVFMVI